MTVCLRAPDPAIPDGEWLYRRALPEHVLGGALLEAAIDLPTTSVNRGAFSAPEDVRRDDRPKFTEVARVMAGNMPAPITRETGAPFAWRAFDDPLPDDRAHAEIRLLRQDPTGPGLTRIPRLVKERARTLLAERFEVMLGLDPPAWA